MGEWFGGFRGDVKPENCSANAMAEKSKGIAGFLGFFFGIIGLQRFYLGNPILALVYTFSGIGIFAGWIEAIVFWSTSDDDWDRKYNPELLEKRQEKKRQLARKEQARAEGLRRISEGGGVSARTARRNFVLGAKQVPHLKAIRRLSSLRDEGALSPKEYNYYVHQVQSNGWARVPALKGLEEAFSMYRRGELNESQFVLEKRRWLNHLTKD